MTCLILVSTANLTDVEIEREISWSELRMSGAISSDHSDVTRGGTQGSQTNWENDRNV